MPQPVSQSPLSPSLPAAHAPTARHSSSSLPSSKDSLHTHSDSPKKISLTNFIFTGLKFVITSLAKLPGYLYACLQRLFSRTNEVNRFEKKWKELTPDRRVSSLVNFYHGELQRAKTEDELRMVHEEYGEFHLRLDDPTRETIQRALQRKNSSPTSANRFFKWEHAHPHSLITDVIELFAKELEQANDEASIIQLFDELNEFVLTLDRQEIIINPVNERMQQLCVSFSEQKNGWISKRLSPKEIPLTPLNLAKIMPQMLQLASTNPATAQVVQQFGIQPEAIESMREEFSHLIEQFNSEEMSEEALSSLFQQLENADPSLLPPQLQEMGVTPQLVASLKDQLIELAKERRQNG